MYILYMTICVTPAIHVFRYITCVSARTNNIVWNVTKKEGIPVDCVSITGVCNYAIEFDLQHYGEDTHPEPCGAVTKVRLKVRIRGFSDLLSATKVWLSFTFLQLDRYLNIKLCLFCINFISIKPRNYMFSILCGLILTFLEHSMHCEGHQGWLNINNTSQLLYYIHHCVFILEQALAKSYVMT